MQQKYSYIPDLLHQTLSAVSSISQNIFDTTRKNNFLNILFAVLNCTVKQNKTKQNPCSITAFI